MHSLTCKDMSRIPFLFSLTHLTHLGIGFSFRCPYNTNSIMEVRKFYTNIFYFPSPNLLIVNINLRLSKLSGQC